MRPLIIKVRILIGRYVLAAMFEHYNSSTYDAKLAINNMSFYMLTSTNNPAAVCAFFSIHFVYNEYTCPTTSTTLNYDSTTDYEHYCCTHSKKKDYSQSQASPRFLFGTSKSHQKWTGYPNPLVR